MESNILKKLLEVSISLSAEKNDEKVLGIILDTAMSLTNCDAGTLYIKNEDKLYFKIMFTNSMGEAIKKDNLPPVEIESTNICARALIERKIINIKDVYDENNFDFSGAKKYDKLTGYKTVSMLVVPMEDNRDEQIGVLQLINAKTSSEQIVPFKKEHEIYISALTSQAAICLVKMNQAQEIQGLLDSLVRALSTAIYERTPYNVTHTKNMVKYTERFLDWLDANCKKDRFCAHKRRQFLMSVWLHDVGKLTVPLEVMNKETRLSSGLERLLTRLDIIELLARLEHAENGAELSPVMDKLKRARHIISEANGAMYLSDELEQEVKEISKYTYKDKDGEIKPWLTEHETECLCIKKGTLTAQERNVMESHVLMTKRILSQVSFGSEYENVAKWASEHHEFLNGKGYPNKINNGQLCYETRLLTIIDVFDGLFSKDRPYRKPLTIEKTLEIINDMADCGQLDKDILKLFLESRVWED